MLLSSQVFKTFSDIKNSSKPLWEPAPMPNHVALASILVERRIPDGTDAFSETPVMSVQCWALKAPSHLGFSEIHTLVTPKGKAFTTLTWSWNYLLCFCLHYFWKSGKVFKSTLHHFSASAVLKLSAVLLTCQAALSAQLCCGTFDGHQRQP